MLGPCRHHGAGVAAHAELAATLPADGEASDPYGTAGAAIAVVLHVVRQVPHR